jgi:hypothetical protein
MRTVNRGQRYERSGSAASTTTANKLVKHGF